MKPHHMQRGFDLNESTLSAASAINWGNNLVPATSDPVRIKDMIAFDTVEKQQMAVGSGIPRVYRTFLLTPPVARDLAKMYKSKGCLEHALVETARHPLGQRAFANYWGNPGSAFDSATCPLSVQEARIAEAEGAAETVTPPWLEWTGFKTMVTVPTMEEGKNVFIVTGDPDRNKELCLPGGASATVRIALPAAWDKLMAERNYEPLQKFMIDCGVSPDVPQLQVRECDRPAVRGFQGPSGAYDPGMGQFDRRYGNGFGRYGRGMMGGYGGYGRGYGRGYGQEMGRYYRSGYGRGNGGGYGGPGFGYRP